MGDPMATRRKPPVAQTKSAGQQLVDDLSQTGDTRSLTAMIVEAGRIKDRLDRLDALLIGEETLWMRLVNRRGDGGTLEVYVDNALSEARQQATVLRHLIGEIHKQRGQTRTGPTDDDLAGL